MLREFIRGCASRVVEDSNLAAKHAVFVRTEAYFAELTDLGAALVQIRAPLTGRRSTARRTGVLKLLGILRATGTRNEVDQRTQLLLDSRVAEVIVPVRTTVFDRCMFALI